MKAPSPGRLPRPSAARVKMNPLSTMKRATAVCPSISTAASGLVVCTHCQSVNPVPKSNSAENSWKPRQATISSAANARR